MKGETAGEERGRHEHILLSMTMSDFKIKTAEELQENGVDVVDFLAKNTEYSMERMNDNLVVVRNDVVSEACKKRKVAVVNGLEASQIALLVQGANKFDSRIEIVSGKKVASAKSIMGIISIGMLDGVEIIVRAEGHDSEQAVNRISQFIENIR